MCRSEAFIVYQLKFLKLFGFHPLGSKDLIPFRWTLWEKMGKKRIKSSKTFPLANSNFNLKGSLLSTRHSKD
jgi:hypothetical protein